MARPTFKTAPTAAELAAVECLEERGDAITRLAGRFRTLPKPHADLRKETFQLLLAIPGWTKTRIAERYEMSLGRVSQLTKTTVATSEGN